jgi:hypothetical protein
VRNYEFTIKGVLGALHEDAARDVVDELTGAIVATGGAVDPESLSWDIAIMPQDHREPVASRRVLDDSPQHPWDVGLHIFPTDHPYRRLEDLVLDRGHKDEIHAFQDLTKQLPPGNSE